MDNLEQLEFLSVSNSAVNGEELAKFQILRQLKVLDINCIVNSSKILPIIESSKKLEVLSADTDYFRDRDFGDYCEHLKSKRLNLSIRPAFTETGLAYLQRLKLEALDIREFPLRPETRAVLKGFSHLSRLTLSDTLSASEKDSWQRDLPACRIIWQHNN